MTSLTNSNLELKNRSGQFMKVNTASSSGLGTLPCNTITNPKEDLKSITTRSGIAYKGPTIPTTSSSPKVVERETEVTKGTVPPTNNGSTKDVKSLVVQVETQVPNSEPIVAPVVERVEAPVSAPKPNSRLSIPYMSRLHNQKLREKANDQMEKFFQIFQDLNFNISFADALILMPKIASTIKSLLTNKEKLFELARTPLNEHCSAVLLKKLLETEAIKIKTTKIGIKETIMEILRGTTKEETNSSNELVMVKTRLQLIKPLVIKLWFIKPRFLNLNTASSSGLGTLPCNTITNPKEDLKSITTRSGIAYKGPTIPTTSSSPKVVEREPVEREPEVTKDTVPPTNNESTKDVQPFVVEVKTQKPNSEPVVAPVVEPVEAFVSASKPNPKPSIPYSSRLHDQKLRDKANDQKEKIFQIFQDLNFN
nr:reverse transcriptase domain-containing protein [Tanacetum cinerariifolium]